MPSFVQPIGDARAQQASAGQHLSCRLPKGRALWQGTAANGEGGGTETGTSGAAFAGASSAGASSAGAAAAVFDAFLRFRIDDADRYRVKMSSHSVHTEPNECNFLATPVESGVSVTLFLTAAVNGARHVGK